ncbi:MAG: type II toxin-antitoxin system HicA family toxin [Oscillospiraceae bacterium]|jgi:virulence-associated protein VapD|nr:type II toxin-antitoxin system HicA family toxin [Oscillospiraceae bacterium]
MNEKIFNAVMSVQQDNNIAFNDLRTLLSQLGFRERIKGDHYIYNRAGFPERINIQPNGNMAKGYQIKQVRSLIIKYKMGGKSDV